MKNILIIFFLFLSYNVVAQTRPTGVPTQFSTGWFRWGFAQSDSGLIIGRRDTTFLPRFTGTVVMRPQDRKFYYYDSTDLRWYNFGTSIDTTSLSNRINLKQNILSNAGVLGDSLLIGNSIKRLQNDYGLTFSTNATKILMFIDTLGSNHVVTTSQLKDTAAAIRAAIGGGSGLTSVGLSMPSAFTVTNSPLVANGTLAVSGAGTTAQYIRGNGTLATFDTGAIPNFYLKVRGLLSGTSPITFNQTTGVIGINNANTSGIKGAATFSAAFQDNGSGTIDLLTLGAAGSCTGCLLNIDAKGRITGYADGPGGATNNANIGAGFRWLNGITQELRTVANSPTITWDSVSTANTLTAKVDTSVIATQYDISQLEAITADNGLTKTSGNIQLGGALIQPTTITSSISANRIVYTGISEFADGPQLEVITGGSAGIAVSGTTTDGRGLLGAATTGVGIYGTATGAGGYGLFGLSVLGNAIYGQADSGIVLEGLMNPTNNNSVLPIMTLDRSAQSAGANGLGVSIDFYLKSSAGDQFANKIVSKWTTATDGSRVSQFEIHGVNNAITARKAALAGSGQWTWDGYPTLTAQVDSATYKPIAIDGSGNVVKMAGWTGGGGGSATLDNIGTGFAWAATPGGNIKRVGNGYGINWDSTSVANTLTAKTDTSVVATLYNVNNLGKTYPREHPYGIIYDKYAWNGADMAAEFTNVSGTTIALNGNYPRSTSSTISWGTYHRFLPLRPTLLPKWSFTVEFQIVSALASNVGFGPAIRSNNINGANYGYGTYISCSSSTGTPHLAKQDGTSDQTNGSFTVAQGDVIRMTLSFNDSVMTLVSQNITTSSSVITVTKTFVAGTAPYVPNTGTLGFQNFSGTYEIRHLSFSSNATFSPTLTVAADSKGQIVSTTFAGRFPSQLNANYPTTLQYSGGGDQLKDFIDKKEEIMQINPEQWWILLGSNDLRYGSSLATTMERVRTIKSWFTGTSTRVYWSVIPEDSTAGGIGLSAFNQSLAAEVGSNYIDLWTPMSTSNILKAIYNSGDGVHPNQAGQNIVYSTGVGSGLLTTISLNRRSPYQKYGGGIQPIGDSLATLYKFERAQYNIPRFDDSLNMTPSFIYHDDSKIMISNNLTQATHFSTALIDIDGTVAMGGAAAAFIYRDRNNPSNYHAQYSANNIFRFVYNGVDYSYIDATGRWKIGEDGATSTESTFHIKKSRTIGNNGIIGVGFALDTATYTVNPVGGYSFFSHASFASPLITSASASTYTDATTVYVGGEPRAGGSETLVRPWSLYIVGKTRLGTTDSVTTANGGFLTKNATTGAVELVASPVSSVTTLYNGNGTLAADRNVASGGFTLRLTGANNSDTLMSIINTGTSSTGLYSIGSSLGVDAQSTTTGLRAFGSVTGMTAEGGTGEGAIIKSDAIRGATIQSVPATTNTVQEVLRIERGSTGGPGANGIGGAADFYNKLSDNSSNVSNQIISQWTNATVGSRVSLLSITGVDNTTTATLLEIGGNGSLKANKYGVGTFTGTPTATLQTTSSGNIIEGPTLAEGTWTPTLTDITNVTTSSVAGAGSYLRVGTKVTFSVQLSVTPTAGASLTQVDITLPIASALANTYELSGVNSGLRGYVIGQTANDRASVVFTSDVSGAETITVHVTYRIL